MDFYNNNSIKIVCTEKLEMGQNMERDCINRTRILKTWLFVCHKNNEKNFKLSTFVNIQLITSIFEISLLCSMVALV